MRVEWNEECFCFLLHSPQSIVYSLLIENLSFFNSSDITYNFCLKRSHHRRPPFRLWRTAFPSTRHDLKKKKTKKIRKKVAEKKRADIRTFWNDSGERWKKAAANSLKWLNANVLCTIFILFITWTEFADSHLRQMWQNVSDGGVGGGVAWESRQQSPSSQMLCMYCVSHTPIWNMDSNGERQETCDTCGCVLVCSVHRMHEYSYKTFRARLTIVKTSGIILFTKW